MASASLTFVSAAANSAVLRYTASDFVKPGNTTGSWEETYRSSETGTSQVRTMKRESISYGDLNYSWSFGETGQTGTHTFTGLNSGTSNTCSGTVTVTCQKTTTTETRTDTRTRSYTPPKEGEKEGTYGSWSSWSSGTPSSSSSSETVTIGTASASRIVYTKPSTFSWSGDISEDKTIELNLKASDWNILVTKAEQKNNWRNQSSGTNYSGDEVDSGDLITANKYNSLAQHCGASNRVTGGTNGTVISASLFIALQTAINS